MESLQSLIGITNNIHAEYINNIYNSTRQQFLKCKNQFNSQFLNFVDFKKISETGKHDFIIIKSKLNLIFNL